MKRTEGINPELLKEDSKLADKEYELMIEYTKKVDSIFEPLLEEIATKLNNSNFPNTGKSVIMFITKMEYISTSIFHLYDKLEIYSANALFRVLIEHYFKVNYILMRYQNENNDSVGTDYYKFCDLDEILKLAKAWEKVYELYNFPEKEKDLKQFKDNLAPDLKKYSNGRIKREGSKFNYQEIWKYCAKLLDKEDEINSSHFIILVTEYSKLCSFVHGGPKAEGYLIDCADLHLKKNKYIGILKSVFVMNAFVKQMLLIISSRVDEKYFKIQEEIHKIQLEFKSTLDKWEKEFSKKGNNILKEQSKSI